MIYILAGRNIGSPLKLAYNTRSRKRQMENEERAQLEAQHKKKRWIILKKKSQGLLVYSSRP